MDNKDKREIRQIKFRYWNGRKMYYNVGYHPHEAYNRGLEPDSGYEEDAEGSLTYAPFLSGHLMQFTGLLDRNGVEIYEGDIVQFLDGSYISTESGIDTDEYYENGVVEWEPEKQGWDISNRNDVDWIDVWDDVRVIGNIYSDPTLIQNSLKQ